MSTYQPFRSARPIWAEGLEHEKNITLGLHTVLHTTADRVTLRVATSGFYRVFVNGEFVFYGPARCAHGFFRVDEVPLTLPAGAVHIALEVVNYRSIAFGYISQEGFIRAELELPDGTVPAATGESGFELYQLHERVRRVQRYSYQRPAAESYRLTADYARWRIGGNSAAAVAVCAAIGTEQTSVPRRIPLNTFPKAPVTRLESHGRVAVGVKPAAYLKDRSLTGILEAEHGFIEGFFEQELEHHLSDDVQEQAVLHKTVDGTPYAGHSTLTAGDFEILSLDGEKTGFITVDIRCQQAGVLYFMFDEILTEEGDVDPHRMECCNVVRLELKEGDYRFQTMEPYGFRYLKAVCTAGHVTLTAPAVVELICPRPFTGAYTGDDAALAVIFNAARETFLQNSSDLLMDCPTRERAAWLCDSFFSARTEFEFTGDNVIEKNFLENYLLPDRFPLIPEGMVPMCYPSDHGDGNFIPNWAMFLVLELADRQRRVGDTAFVEAFRPRVYALLDWFSRYENADGLLEKLPGWVFVEWSMANELVQDINYPTNMLYAFMLEEAAELYGDMALRDKADAIRQTVRRHAFDGAFFVDNAVYRDGVATLTGERTETCQYYAFFTGVATPERYPALWKTLLEDFGPEREHTHAYPEIYPANAFIGNYLRLMLLEKAGL